jgi:hypothetical protein
VHSAPGLEIRIEVLNSPGPGEIRVAFGDTLYTTLAGSGVLGVAERNPLLLSRGEAALVPHGTKHVIFGNPDVSLLVIVTPAWSSPLNPLAPCRRP